jgi:putative transposase
MIERQGPLSLSRQCELLGLSRTALYYRAVRTGAYELELMALIDRQYLQTPFYGSRRMAAWLQAQGHAVNRKRVQLLMLRMGLAAIYQRPRTSKPAPMEDALSHGRPEIFNTDQGGQCAISMDGRGRFADNIFVERLWRSLKYEEVVCCESFIGDGGRPPGVGLQGAGFKPPQAARVKSPGGERCGKRRRNTSSGASRGDERK